MNCDSTKRPTSAVLMCFSLDRNFLDFYSNFVGHNGDHLKTRVFLRVPVAPLHVTILGKLFTHNMPLFTKQYKLKLVPAIGWEGKTVGLASHWPCVTDSVVYPMTQWPGKGRRAPRLYAPFGV